MQIRQAMPTDFSEIDSFDIFAGDRNAEIHRGEVWVAVIGNTIAGYITFNHSFYQKPFIQYLNVKDNFRKQGIAQALISFIEGIGKHEKLFASTESNNLSMLRLLEKNNYQVVGVIEKLQDCAEIVYCKEFRG